MKELNNLCGYDPLRDRWPRARVDKKRAEIVRHQLPYGPKKEVETQPHADNLRQNS